MNRENRNDMEYMLEIDRMINEGLGGGMIEYDYQRKQLEIPERRKLRKSSDSTEKDAS